MVFRCRRIESAAFALIVFAACADPARADDTVVRQFSTGASPDSVGVIDGNEDVEMFGPQALTMDADGNLFLLDQVNGRIVRFDPKQPASEPGILKMPDDVRPTDLVVNKNDIMVWDNSIRTFRAPDTPSTRGLDNEPVELREVSSRGVDDRIAISAFAQMGSQPPGAASDLLDGNTRAVVIKKKRQPSRQYIASRGKGSIEADVIPEKGDNEVRIEVVLMDTKETVAQLSLRTRDRLGTVEFLEIDNSDRLYVLAEEIPASGKRARTFVARYASNGKFEGVYELPLSNTPLTRRFVTISGDGDVYFLRTLPDGVAVIAVGFRPMGEPSAGSTEAASGGSPASQPSSGKFEGVAAVRPSNRQQAIETAFAFEGIQWKLTPANYGSDPDTACSGFSRIRRPWYLEGKVNQEVRGVPYCWGCHGSLASFRAQMDRGVKAGNVCTHNAPRPDVAGVDCSAFVSAAWGLSVHYTTAAIPAIAKPLSNPWDLKPGDALNKSGSHVMLFLRFMPDRKAEVMEASTGGCNGRVCRNIYPLAGLLARGYVPVRFRAFVDDQMVVSENAYDTSTPTGRESKAARARKKP
jgi:hypothetical protein